MMTREQGTGPVDIDPGRPSVARIYDYCLGGSHHFEVDREAAEQIITRAPQMVATWRANRAFLRRVVRFCVRHGVDQFLDLGSGIPTVGNVHEIAQTANGGARVVYVDVDPVAVAHASTLLAGNPYATAVRADIANTDYLLKHPELRTMLDFGRPVAILMVAVLHFLPDAETAVAAYRDAVPPGSMLAISHATSDESAPWWQEALRAFAASGTVPGGGSGYIRTAAEIASLFGDFALEPPGLVRLPRWHPDAAPAPGEDDPDQFPAYGAVGVKP
jgi:SAM-dependent methyltransferase